MSMGDVVIMKTAKAAKQSVFIVHRHGTYFGTFSTLKKAQDACIKDALEWKWEGSCLNTYNREYRITESEVA